MSGLLPPRLDDQVVVQVAPWEIECCRLAPVVGGLTTWQLWFTALDRPERYWLPPAVSYLVWEVEEWPTHGGPHRLITRGGIRAVVDGDPWTSSRPVMVPEVGRRRLTGVLSGRGHGGSGELDGAPHTTALVESLAVATTDHTPHEHSWARHASLHALQPVDRSPRWFEDRPVRATGRTRRSEALVMWVS